MPVKRIITQGKVPVKIYTDDIEVSAYRQLCQIAELPIIYHHVAAMPDVHTGIGATIGSVIPTRDAIIPAAVGVDIGCGMNAIRLTIRAEDLPNNLKKIRSAIESAVPVGFDMHRSCIVEQSTLTKLANGLKKIHEKHPQLVKMQKKPHETWIRQLGTLGGGNHFIELCLDENNNVWIMLHSGSRGTGNAIGRYFIQLARTDMESQQVNLPNKNLSYFKEGMKYFDDYVEAVHWAQDYAMTNRQEMMRLIVNALKEYLPMFESTSEAINCHHNYVAIENHFGEQIYITRKGAIRAGAGELGIIPGSMGTKSYIVKGKGDATSFSSCAHGAGRRMSRMQAKKQFKINDLEEQTLGVECRKDKGIIDEIPAAYKDIDLVMENQSDLVEVVHTLKQIICIKG